MDETPFRQPILLRKNLTSFVELYGPILLVIWTATYDLTQFTQQNTPKLNHDSRHRRKKHIDLSSISISDILGQYHRILGFASCYGSDVNVVFLECPQYSIKIWNENQGHPNSESFH